MAIEVEYEHESSYGYGRAQTIARVEIGVLGISGRGDTAEAARQDLLHRVRTHQAAVASTIRAIEQSEAPNAATGAHLVEDRGKLGATYETDPGGLRAPFLPPRRGRLA